MSDRPTYDELKKKYGPNWGLLGDEVAPKKPWRSPTWEEVIEYYKQNPGRWAALMTSDPDAAIDRVERAAWEKRRQAL
jgi:hypothetical protein